MWTKNGAKNDDKTRLQWVEVDTIRMFKLAGRPLRMNHVQELLPRGSLLRKPSAISALQRSTPSRPRSLLVAGGTAMCALEGGHSGKRRRMTDISQRPACTIVLCNLPPAAWPGNAHLSTTFGWANRLDEYKPPLRARQRSQPPPAKCTYREVCPLPGLAEQSFQT